MEYGVERAWYLKTVFPQPDPNYDAASCHSSPHRQKKAAPGVEEKVSRNIPAPSDAGCDKAVIPYTEEKCQKGGKDG